MPKSSKVYREKNMRIGIDISQIVHEGTGVARFTHGLVNAILDHDKTNKWTFLFYSLRKNFDDLLEKKIQDKGHKLIKWKLPPTIASFLFNDLHKYSKLLTCLPAGRLLIPFLTSLDWFITSDWIELPLPVKKAAIVHDLVYLRYPETVQQKIVSTQNKRLCWVKKESAVIFSDSESTKHDLVNILGIKEKKIFVNYPGVETVKPSQQQIRQTLDKYHITKSFILSVGKIEPRKNLNRLIEAFNKMKKQDIHLVIVGPKGWQDTSMNRYIEVKHDNVQYLGLVSDSELYSLYKSCLFYIQPSIWEGFGYPVVEAMKLGAPVAASNTSSLKEIAQDAALLFNPFKVDEITQAIDKLISDENLRKQIVRKGLERSKIYIWQNYYQRMIKALIVNS